MFGIRVFLEIVWSVLLWSGCATLPKDFDRPESYAWPDTRNTAPGRMLADQRAANPGKSGFYLLEGGLDALVARWSFAKTKTARTKSSGTGSWTGKRRNPWLGMAKSITLKCAAYRIIREVPFTHGCGT